MDKQLLKKFFLLFSTSFVGILLICAIAVQTGFYKYEDHIARYFRDETHLASFVREESTKQYAFLNKGKVKAGWVEDGCSIAKMMPGNPAGLACQVSENWPKLQAAAETLKIFASCLADSQGTVNCMITNSIEVFNELVMGGPFFACKNPLILGKTDERCKMDTGLVSKFPTRENLQSPSEAFYPKMPGLLGIAYFAGAESYKELSTIPRIDLYYNNTLAQIPLLNNNTAKANVVSGDMEYGFIKNLSFGKVFFEIWSLVRNISYYLIVIPVVALGFAIMFKVQINSQTQITLIKILPRLIVVMILITFSYPIAALLLQVSKPIVDIIIAIIYQPISTMMDPGAWLATSVYLIILLGGIALLVSSIGTPIALVLLVLIVGIVLLIVLVRYFMVVISTAFKLGFLIAFSPLILLISVFPGREGIMKQYFINLIASIAGVMAIPIMFWVAILVFSIGSNVAFHDDNPLFMLMIWLVGMGVFWKIADAPKIVAQAIGAKSLLAESGFGGEQKRR